MYATAMAVTRDEDDAMDAIQDTVLALWEKLSTLREPDYFKTWMTHILVNFCRGRLREKKRTVLLDEDLETGEEPDLDGPLDVGRALDTLSQEDRLVLQLYYFEDMAVKDIGEALELSPEAVRMRLSRGRKRFRAQYQKGGAV